jgi:hypothetical protein
MLQKIEKMQKAAEKREFFDQMQGLLKNDPILAEEEEKKFLTLGEDYFSYALFAFYLFEEEEELFNKGDTRMSEAKENVKLALSNDNLRATE